MVYRVRTYVEKYPLAPTDSFSDVSKSLSTQPVVPQDLLVSPFRGMLNPLIQVFSTTTGTKCDRLPTLSLGQPHMLPPTWVVEGES